MAPPETVADIATNLHVDDLLVFALREDGASLLGGSGRGAGWAGIVELTAASEPRLAELLERRRVQRVDGDGPVRIVGPTGLPTPRSFRSATTWWWSGRRSGSAPPAASWSATPQRHWP